jgi:hypothetical protein
VDRVYAADGVEATCFLQVKARSHAAPDGRYSWVVPAAHFKPYPRFFLALALVNLETGHLVDLVWLLPSRVISKLAARSVGHGGPEFEVTASPLGHDKFSRYRTTLDQLGQQLAPALTLPPAVRPRFPAVTTEQGAFYEFALVAEQLRESRDDVLLFRPASDVEGRDLLIQRVDTPRAIFFQVKGTSRIAATDSVQFWVRRSTFRPQENFWLGFYFYDPRQGALFEDCWLVPSQAFARRTAAQRDKTARVFSARLARGHDRWAEFRVPVRAQGTVLRRALRAARA